MKNLRNILKTNQLLYLIVLLGTFSAINLFSMRMTEKGKMYAKKFLEREGLLKKKKAETRNLLIFLDDSEKSQMGIVGGI